MSIGVAGASLEAFWTAHTGAIERHGSGRGDHRCGSCTLCCTVMRVDMAPAKPAYETCRHCTSAGCGIYEQRPEPCRGFQCLWLASQMSEALSLPAALRPDRCGVAIDVNAAGTVMAHCSHPGAWKREPIRAWLLDYAAKTNVILELPTGAELLSADGNTEPLVKVGVHPSGNRLYAVRSELEREGEVA